MTATLKILLKMNKDQFNQGVDMMIENFRSQVETLLMFGEKIIIDSNFFYGTQEVFVKVHSMKAQCIHFMKIVWQY
jgi:hypothetical protein